MRNREVIEREINNAREDLEASLSELRHVVQEKVDVRARAEVAVEKAKLAAQELLERGKAYGKFYAEKGKYEAQQLVNRGRETVEERPVLVGAIAAGVIGAAVFIYVGRKRDWF